MKTIFISAFICFICGNILAQEKITLEKAIEMATTNSLKIKNEVLNSEYLMRLTKTAYDIPNTTVGTELGQFNSNVFDVKLGVSQNIKFPSVYKKQKQLLLEEAKAGEWNEAMQKRAVAKQVPPVFYEMIYLQEKEKLLLRLDSIYSEFLRKATLRFNKGESNILEKTTAENQLGQIKVQLEELRSDYKILQTQFNYLLNSRTNYLPVADKYKLDFVENAEDNFNTATPVIKLIEQEKNINSAKIMVEKSKKTPEFIGGLYYQTFRTNAALQNGYNGLYGSLGLAFPIFNTAIKNRVKALEVNNDIANNKLQIEKQNWQNQYQQLLQEYKKYSTTIIFYEKEALKNVDLVLATANKKFISGDINYLEWVMLINQNTEIQSNYVEAIRKLNAAIVQLNLLTNK